MQRKILAVIPCRQEDRWKLADVVQSIKKQTVAVSRVEVILEKGVGDTLSARVSDVLNKGLKNIDLTEYDYLLRVDSDTLLPENFLEENLKVEPDVMGYGYAMLIKVEPFLKLMNGKFHPEQDDSYIRFKFFFAGLKSLDYVVPPKLLRDSGKPHGKKYFIDRGVMFYRFGYEPIHVLSKMFIDVHNFWTGIGYLKAVIKKPKKFEFASNVTHLQLKKLRSLHKLHGTIFNYILCFGRGNRKYRRER